MDSFCGARRGYFARILFTMTITTLKAKANSGLLVVATCQLYHVGEQVTPSVNRVALHFWKASFYPRSLLSLNAHVDVSYHLNTQFWLRAFFTRSTPLSRLLCALAIGRQCQAVCYPYWRCDFLRLVFKRRVIVVRLLLSVLMGLSTISITYT